MFLKKSWSDCRGSPAFSFQLFASVAVLIIIMFLLPGFFNFIQQRKGWVLQDSLLRLIPARDVSFITFTFIYSALIITAITLTGYPLLLLRTLQSYCFLLIIRILCIWLIPLNEPPELIFLNDPFVSSIGYGGKPITKDLFFSGHTATLFLLFLCAPHRWLKIFLLLITIAVATCVLIQHVHYVVDVIAAPFFAWFSYKVFFNRHSGKLINTSQ
ncbi:MAG: phosphatase PAP2-related protein [Chitinophagales bacterium]